MKILRHGIVRSENIHNLIHFIILHKLSTSTYKDVWRKVSAKIIPKKNLLLANSEQKLV